MKKNILTSLLFFTILVLEAQETVTTTRKYGIENTEVLDLFQFQGIAVEEFNFASSSIKGKSYIVNIKEFKDGQLIQTKPLFNGTYSDLNKIKSSIFSLKIITQLSKENLKVQLRKKEYSSGKLNFNLLENKYGYVMKDFLGGKIAIQNPINKEFALLAIITPTELGEGMASYCEVVQTDVKPENLGKHFKIPHYFLITMEFK